MARLRLELAVHELDLDLDDVRSSRKEGVEGLLGLEHADVAALGIDPDSGFDAAFLADMQSHVEAIARDQTERFMVELGLAGGGDDAARLAAEGLLISRELMATMQLRMVLATLRARRHDDLPPPHVAS